MKIEERDAMDEDLTWPPADETADLEVRLWQPDKDGAWPPAEAPRAVAAVPTLDDFDGENAGPAQVLAPVEQPESLGTPEAAAAGRRPAPWGLSQTASPADVDSKERTASETFPTASADNGAVSADRAGNVPPPVTVPLGASRSAATPRAVRGGLRRVRISRATLRRIERVALLALLLLAVGETAFIAYRGTGQVRPPATGRATLPGAKITGSLSPSPSTERRPAPATSDQAIGTAGGPAAPVTATLAIRTEPVGGFVSINGERRGRAPLTLTGVAAGDYDVLVQSETANVRQKVHVEAGSTTSLVIPLAAVGPATGWLRVSSPFEVQLLEGGRIVGTSRSDRTLLPAGKHALELVSDAVGYRDTQSVTVSAGKTTAIALEPPNGVLDVNAIPWANVSIDGTDVGQTPLGNLALSPGSHEVRFHHPTLGDRSRTVTVRLDGPTRVSVDMSK